MFAMCLVVLFRLFSLPLSLSFSPLFLSFRLLFLLSFSLAPPHVCTLSAWLWFVLSVSRSMSRSHKFPPASQRLCQQLCGRNFSTPSVSLLPCELALTSISPRSFSTPRKVPFAPSLWLAMLLPPRLGIRSATPQLCHHVIIVWCWCWCWYAQALSLSLSLSLSLCVCVRVCVFACVCVCVCVRICVCVSLSRLRRFRSVIPLRCLFVASPPLPPAARLESRHRLSLLRSPAVRFQESASRGKLGTTRHDTTRHDTTRHDTTRHDRTEGKRAEQRAHVRVRTYVRYGGRGGEVCTVWWR